MDGHLARGKGADPVLGSLGIQHNGNGQAQLLPDALDQLNLLFMFLMGPVGEIQPGNVHAGQAHLRQRLLVLTGGANGTNNFRFAHAKTLLFLQSISYTALFYHRHPLPSMRIPVKNR